MPRIWAPWALARANWMPTSLLPEKLLPCFRRYGEEGRWEAPVYQSHRVTTGQQGPVHLATLSGGMSSVAGSEKQQGGGATHLHGHAAQHLAAQVLVAATGKEGQSGGS